MDQSKQAPEMKAAVRKARTFAKRLVEQSCPCLDYVASMLSLV